MKTCNALLCKNICLFAGLNIVKMEFVSPEGLRVDGRRPQELRALQCKFSVLSSCDGSALFQAGNTKVDSCIYMLLKKLSVQDTILKTTYVWQCLARCLQRCMVPEWQIFAARHCPARRSLSVNAPTRPSAQVRVKSSALQCWSLAILRSADRSRCRVGAGLRQCAAA